MTEEKEKAGCWLCGKSGSKWTVLLADGKKEGAYCTKSCAQLGMCGPQYKDSRPVLRSGK